jgi:putative transposase
MRRVWDLTTPHAQGMEADSMLDSFDSRVASARESDQLFFASLLPKESISRAFGDASAILDSRRIYTTAVTLWTFLAQVLSSDHGCVEAVAKLISFRAANHESIPAPETGAYCIARDQLDETGMHQLLRQTGEDIEGSTPRQTDCGSQFVSNHR